MGLKEYQIQELPFVKIWGRTAEDRQPLTLFWTGSGIECNVRASELWIQIEADYEVYEPWMSVIINGAYVSRLMLQKGKQWICLFRGMDQEKIKNVRVLKEVQAMPEDEAHCMQILAFKTEGSFLPVEERKYKFEFIGDSITSGEGSMGAREEEDWIPMWFSTQHNYVRYVCEIMDAEYRILSQSGWGVCCSWDNNPYSNLPDYYEDVCGVVKGAKNKQLGACEKYDFDAWKPAAIMINLGTNDGSAFDQPAWLDEKTGESYKLWKNRDGSYEKQSIEKVQKAVVNFLKKVRKNNPASQIVWLYGMLGSQMFSFIEQAVADYKETYGDDKVHLCKLPDTTAETVGARQHPGKLAHQAAARVIADFLGQIVL